MKTNCIHYDNCRLPVQKCNNRCERGKCAERDFGTYETTKRGKTEPAEFTKHGWKVSWSRWYQNDSDLDNIGERLAL